MKLSGLVKVLSTVLPLAGFASADPIPAYALSKRDVNLDNPYEHDGVGPRYWGWAKLAYDNDYNGGPSFGTEQAGKELGVATSKDWEILHGSEQQIFVKGYSGARIQAGITPWPTLTGMKGIVAVDNLEKVIVLGFIGSNDRPTFKQDFKFSEIKAEGITGEVSKGFYQCFESVYKTLFPWLKEYADEHPDWKIVIVGHSLGGATAHIAAARLATYFSNEGYAERTYVFTYGAPRAGDITFQKSLRETYGDRMINFRHIHDGVPYLPFIHQSPVDTYGNPPRRAVFHARNGPGSKWQDAANWDPIIDDADQDRAGFEAFWVNIAKNLMQGFAQHTKYFSRDPAPTKRDVDTSRVVRHQKRAEVTYENRVKAEEALTRMRSNGDMRRTPEWSGNLKEFATALGSATRQKEIMDALNEFNNEQDRIDFLGFGMVFAVEGAQ